MCGVSHAGMAGMPAGAMMPGMYNPQGMPHLPQLAQPNMMATASMGYGQMGPQQAFGATNQGSGSCCSLNSYSTDTNGMPLGRAIGC